MSNADFPRTWKFKSDNGDADGATFLGRFTGVIDMASTAYGDKPVAQFTVEETGETVSIWLLNGILQDQVVKLAPEPGELVKIDYLGKKKSKSTGRDYQSYRATAPERPSASLSWAALGASDDDTEDVEF